MKNMSAKDILEIKIRCLIEVIQDLRAERVVVYDKKIDNLKPIVMRLGAKFKTSRIHKVADKEKNASIVAELASGDTRVLVTCVFQPERLHVGNFDMFVFMGIIEEVKRHTELIGDLGPTYKGRWIITFTEDYNIRTFENCLFNQAITPRNIKEEVSINATVRRGVLSYYALECERQNLSKVQKDCLTKLQSRIKVPYDRSLVEHEEALKSLLETGTPDLWQYGIPGEELSLLFFKQFKERAYLWKDPSTDFRGGGFISLENLLYFARNFPKSFHAILHKTEGHRVMWEYPVALASVNITFMLIQMLNLDAAKQRSLVGATFLKCLAENDSAFDLLYCITFKLMDSQWLAMRALYMDFNAVMESTRRQLEKELLQDDITQLEDLPSFFLLSR